jgi:hypothetical protein
VDDEVVAAETGFVLVLDRLQSAQVDDDEVVAAETGFVLLLDRLQSAQVDDELVAAETGFVVVVVVCAGVVVVVVVQGSVLDEPPPAGQVPCARAPAAKKRSSLALMIKGVTG